MKSSKSIGHIIDLIKNSNGVSSMSSKIIAINGGGGAGKTTFSGILSKYLGDCMIVHTDDFASWDNPINWHKRAIDELFTPLAENKAANYQVHDWKFNKLGDWACVNCEDYIIVEGVGSSREEFRKFLSFSIFIEAEEDLRLERGLERDAKNAEKEGMRKDHETAELQWKNWLRQESGHFKEDDPRLFADIIISGEEPFSFESVSIINSL